MFKRIWFITFFLCLIGFIANANADGAPPDYTLDVHGKDNCILLDPTVAARIRIPAGDYRVEVSGNAFYEDANSFGNVLVRYAGEIDHTDRDYLEALPIGESTSLHFRDTYSTYYNFMAFFADSGDLTDNSGTVTINFYEGSNSLPSYFLNVHGRDNCIRLDNSVAISTNILGGKYQIEVSGDAFYYPDNSHGKVFIRYRGTDRDYLEALLIGGSTVLQLKDGTFYAFFADWSSIGDNSGVVTINFYSLPGAPSADAGPDQVVFDEVTLDGSGSSDPDGEIVSYQWELLHRENSAYNRTAEGVNQTILDLEPGFYDVVLTVTDNEGAIDNDTMLLGAAGPCEEWPQPDLTGEWTKFSLSYRGTRTIIEGELTIRNIGTEDAGNFKVAYYLSDDNVLDGGDSLIKTKTIRSLPAGNSQKLQFIYQSKDPLQGKFIIAEVDSDNQVLESDEGNNIVTSPQIP